MWNGRIYLCFLLFFLIGKFISVPYWTFSSVFNRTKSIGIVSYFKKLKNTNKRCKMKTNPWRLGVFLLYIVQKRLCPCDMISLVPFFRMQCLKILSRLSFYYCKIFGQMLQSHEYWMSNSFETPSCSLWCHCNNFDNQWMKLFQIDSWPTIRRYSWHADIFIVRHMIYQK